jgi:hypothetical protein
VSRDMRFVLTLTVSFLTLAVPGSGLRAQSAPFDSLRDSIVQIADGDQANPRVVGTGFLVDGRCTIFTAKHVLATADKKTPLVRFSVPNDRTRIGTGRATVVYEDPSSDAAIVRPLQSPCGATKNASTIECVRVRRSVWPLPSRKTKVEHRHQDRFRKACGQAFLALELR